MSKRKARPCERSAPTMRRALWTLLTTQGAFVLLPQSESPAEIDGGREATPGTDRLWPSIARVREEGFASPGTSTSQKPFDTGQRY